MLAATEVIRQNLHMNDCTQKQVSIKLSQPAQPTAKANSARLLVGSALPSALITTHYAGSAEVDATDVLKQLNAMAADVAGGDLSAVEQMLLHQAIALQTMFMDLAVRAKGQKELTAVQSLTQMALKAQSGSRATLQTLGDLKNPRPVFVRQTNVAQTQQVNNGSQELPPVSRAKNQPLAPNELIAPNQEHHGSTTLDARAAAAASPADSAEQALGALNRTAKRRR